MDIQVIPQMDGYWGDQRNKNRKVTIVIIDMKDDGDVNQVSERGF